jgi:hypothetical protein
MNKIPVGRTIAETYSFAFGRYLPILGVIWLPLLIMTLIVYFLVMPALVNLPQAIGEMIRVAQQHPSQPAYPPAAFSQSVGRLNAFNLIILLLYAPIAVGVMKEALGTRTGPRFVYVSVGTPELLVLGGWIAAFAIIYAVILAVVIVLAIVAVIGAIIFASTSVEHADPRAFAALVPFAVLLIVAIELGIFYAYLRLTYLMIPVSVAEGKFGVFRSWQLTKGNFWRIFAILIVTMLPLVVLEIVAVLVLLGPAIAQFASQISGHPSDPGPALGVFMQSMWHSYMYTWPVGLAIAPVVCGLLFGQAAFAYRALTPAAKESS